MAEVNQDSQNNVNGASLNSSASSNDKNNATLTNKNEVNAPSVGSTSSSVSTPSQATGSGEKVTLPSSNKDDCKRNPPSKFKLFIYGIVHFFSFLIEKIGLGFFAIGLYLLYTAVDYVSLGLIAEGVVMMALAIWNISIIKRRKQG